MADCCAELKNELAALRAEVSKLGKVDEDSIIQKAFNKSKDYLEPVIAGVSVIAVGAKVTALKGVSLSEIASIKAGSAFSEAAAAGKVSAVAQKTSLAAEFAALTADRKATQASTVSKIAQGAATAAGNVASAANAFAASALGKAILALANIATIAGSIAGLFALYATLKVVFPRLDAHDYQLQSIESQLAKDSTAITNLTLKQRRIESDVYKANQTAERANDLAYNANIKINILQAKYDEAATKIKVLEPKVADNITKIQVLTPKVNTVIGEVEALQPKVADTAVKLQVLTPKVNDVTTRVNRVEPKVEDNTTKIRVLTPKVTEVTGRVNTLEPTVANNTTKIRTLTPKVDEAVRIANEALKAKSIPGKDGRPGKDAVSIPGKDGKPGINGKPGANGLSVIGQPGAPGKNGVGLPGKVGTPGQAGAPGKTGAPGKDAKEDPALKIRLNTLENKVKEQEKLNQQGVLLLQQLPTVLEPQITNAVTKTVNAIVPTSIEQSIANNKKTFEDIATANRKALEPQFQKTVDANKAELARVITPLTQGITALDTKVKTIVPTPSTTPGTKQPSNQDLEQQIRLGVGGITVLLAGVTAALRPIPTINTNTTPAAIQNNTAAGVCRTTQPGGCMSNLANNVGNTAANRVNNNLGNILGGVNTAANAAQLALLRTIQTGVNTANTKLGPLMRGANGIGGAVSRLSSSLGVDRALNLIAIAANLHNAMMLSANLKITLLEVLSTVGNATGLLQTSEGENVDLNKVFNTGIESFVTLLIGTENYAGLKIGFRKYNSIYRAATNSLNAISSMFNSLGEAVETAGEYTGKIGNALRAASVVRENAYNFMSEKLTVKSSRFMTFETKVGGVTQILETVNEVAENIVEGQQQYTEAVKATADFQKQLADAQKNPGIDNKAVKIESDKIKANLIADPTGEDEVGLLSFLTD